MCVTISHTLMDPTSSLYMEWCSGYLCIPSHQHGAVWYQYYSCENMSFQIVQGFEREIAFDRLLIFLNLLSNGVIIIPKSLNGFQGVSVYKTH